MTVFLAPALGENTSIKELYLSGNQFGEFFLRSFLLVKHKVIEYNWDYLSLSFFSFFGNACSGVEGMRLLGQALAKRSNALVVLDLSDCKINVKYDFAFAFALPLPFLLFHLSYSKLLSRKI